MNVLHKSETVERRGYASDQITNRISQKSLRY